MARQRMVTRTIKDVKVAVMTLDIESAEPGNEVVRVPFEVAPEKRLSYIQKHYDTDTVKNVAIVSEEIVEKYYGMLETDFIKHAKIIDKKSADENKGE